MMKPEVQASLNHFVEQNPPSASRFAVTCRRFVEASKYSLELRWREWACALVEAFGGLRVRILEIIVLCC